MCLSSKEIKIFLFSRLTLRTIPEINTKEVAGKILLIKKKKSFSFTKICNIKKKRTMNFFSVLHCQKAQFQY